jgi:hypothetical protein
MVYRHKKNTPVGFETAFRDFQGSYPAYRQSEINELRAREYSRLDEQDQVYLDYTGSGL